MAEEWDQPLPEPLKGQWEEWKRSLDRLEGLYIPRMFTPLSLSQAEAKKVHIFSDASEKAISAVAYVAATIGTNTDVGFVMGKSKLSPHGGTTIPRLELCAAVLATELASIIIEQLDFSPDDFSYHTDSKIVLGYISNRSRRFYTYVGNRVQVILRQSKASQWCYVSTQSNHADLGTRCLRTPEDFLTSPWITGPEFLRSSLACQPVLEEGSFRLVEPEDDQELRPEISVKKTALGKSMASRFEYFSTWPSLIRAFSLLKRVTRSRKHRGDHVPEAVALSKRRENLFFR